MNIHLTLNPQTHKQRCERRNDNSIIILKSFNKAGSETNSGTATCGQWRATEIRVYTVINNIGRP